MAVLEVMINSKVYQIGCEDEEKDYISTLVAEINSRINKAKQQNPKFFSDLTDDKLFLYQLLLVYSEFKELQKNLKQRPKSPKTGSSISEKEITALANSIEHIEKSLAQLDSLLK